MNILVYTQYYPAPKAVRALNDTLVIHYFAKELQKAGHRVQVVCVSLSRVQFLLKNKFRDIIPTEEDYVYDGVNVHLVRYQKLKPHESYPDAFQASIINKRLKKFKQRLGWKPERVFVHFPTSFTGLDEILADGVPVLGDFHNFDAYHVLPRKEGIKAAEFIKKIKNWGYRNVRVYDVLKGIDSREIVRTYSGIDDALLAGDDFIQEKKQRHNKTMEIVFVGRLLPLKNVDIIIRAVKQLSFACRFTIVGDGEEMARLRELAQGADNIRFCGMLPRSEAIEEMKKADVFIMISSPESYGLVYLEAMAQGCITIAARGEGFDGIIKDKENGFLRNPGSVEEAMEALNSIHAMTDVERSEMIAKGYALACSLTEENTARMMLEANV